MTPRTIADIQTQILDNAYTNYGTNQGDTLYYIFHDSNGNLITPSQVNVFVLITFVCATAIQLFEQILYLFQLEMDSLIKSKAIGTAMWVRSKVLEFQYDSTITQVVQYDTITNTVSYPIVNPNYRIITNCSVSQRSNKQITIKVNKSGGAVLSGSELTALQSYLSYVLFAGIQKTIISASPDYLMVECLVYYDGQYVNVIQQNVELAITNYMANLPYDGAIEISELEDAIQLVSGVEDLVFVNVELRGNSTSPANATKLVSNSTTLLRNKNTYAGLAIQDTATGRDFATTITYIPK